MSHHAFASSGLWARSKRPLAAALSLFALLALLPSALVLLAPQAMALAPAIYVPLHTAMEVFAVAVAWMVFGTGWHSFGRRVPPALELLSCAYLGVGLLDIVHLLSYPGMHDFVSPNNTDKAIAFWFAARGLGLLAMLAAAILPWTPRRHRRHRYLPPLVVVAACVLLVATLLAWPQLTPRWFVDGHGVSRSKVWGELALATGYLAATLLLVRRQLRTPSLQAIYLLGAAGTTALSEICMALYTSPYDLFILLGHVYKVIAFYCLYRAIFVEGIHQPYQELRRSEQSLKQSERRFRGLMESAPDAILLIDANGGIAMANARAEQMLTRPRAALLGVAAETLVPGLRGCRADRCTRMGTSVCRLDLHCDDGRGRVFPIEARVGQLDAGGAPMHVAILRDVSERVHFEQALIEQTTHDALTGLPNRMLAREHLRRSLRELCSLRGGVAVIYLGLDHFKRINDTFGHATGDALLIEAGRRLSSLLDEGDMVARQGGDEFIVLLHQPVDADALADSGARLQACVREPFYAEGHEIFLTATLGMAVHAGGEQSEEVLLRRADIAMNHAKAGGRDRLALHTQDMDHGMRERMEMASELRYAVERGELYLLYQPRIDFASGNMIGMEALVRWQHPRLGLVPPLRFIPLAEESGLIEEIGLWVLRSACRQGADWQAGGDAPVRISVNLSARQFLQPQLARQVQTVLDETGLAPRWLELEITEGTVMHDTESAIGTLRSLKRLGVSLSIDDFGTGYSSLSYLKLFPIDVLKIDRSFVKDVIDDADDAAITRAIVGLAKSLELDVVAEGVENAQQAAFLHACGCNEMQGYYFDRPLPAQQIQAQWALPRATAGANSAQGAG